MNYYIDLNAYLFVSQYKKNSFLILFIFHYLDVLEFKPAVTRKLRRRAGVGGVNANSATCSNSGDVSTSNSANFMYWGDLLLCGSRWSTLNQNAKNLVTSTNSSSISTSATSTTTNGANLQTELTVTDDGGGGFQKYSDTPKPNESSSSSNAAPSISNLTKTNLFGSLGLNLIEGGLLSHLLASMNQSSNGFLSNVFGTNGSLGNGPNEMLSFLTNASSSSSVAAVAAGLIMSSGGGLNGVSSALTGSNSLTQPTPRKRRQHNATPSAQLNLLLPEHDIYADLTIIHR